MLLCKKLFKQFGGLVAVSDVSLEVEKGEILGIIGPNGAGKTTFFNLISGFMRPNSGELFFNGENITQCPTETVCAKGIGRTFQIVKPFGDMTVLENVMVGAFLRSRRLAESRQAAAHILEKVGLQAKSHSVAGHLTLAERKRLEVAKALATQPKLLLLDEIMAGLNPTEINVTVNLVRELRAAGVTVIMIEHNMPAVMAVSNRVVVLSNGRKIFEGTPAEVCQDRRVIEAYLGEDYAVAADR